MLKTMLGMLTGSVKCVNFVIKCCKIRYFTGPDEKLKKNT